LLLEQRRGNLWAMSGTDVVSVGAQDRLARTIVRALAYLRAAQLAMWLWVPAVTGLGHVPPVVVAGYVLVVAWSVGVVRGRDPAQWDSFRRGGR